jgi:undecaprenyl-diphosphatase
MDPKTAYFFTILTKFGWLGNWLFLFIALTECIPFIGSVFPGGTLIFISGFLASRGYFHVWDVIIFASLGALIGDYSGYSLGRWGGDWMRKKKIIKPEIAEKGEKFFNKYGPSSILWGRFIGATRAVVPFVSGSTRMPQRVFFFWNLLGAISWAIVHVLLGYFSGNIIATVLHKWSHRLSLILIIVAVALFLYWLIRKHHQNIIQYYTKTSERFTEKIFARDPVTGEFFQNKISQEKIFGAFLSALVLIILYALVMILDLF